MSYLQCFYIFQYLCASIDPHQQIFTKKQELRDVDDRSEKPQVSEFFDACYRLSLKRSKTNDYNVREVNYGHSQKSEISHFDKNAEAGTTEAIKQKYTQLNSLRSSNQSHDVIVLEKSRPSDLYLSKPTKNIRQKEANDQEKDLHNWPICTSIEKVGALRNQKYSESSKSGSDSDCCINGSLDESFCVVDSSTDSDPEDSFYRVFYNKEEKERIGKRANDCLTSNFVSNGQETDGNITECDSDSSDRSVVNQFEIENIKTQVSQNNENKTSSTNIMENATKEATLKRDEFKNTIRGNRYSEVSHVVRKGQFDELNRKIHMYEYFGSDRPNF